MGIEGSRWPRRAVVAAVILVCLGSLVGAATAGTDTPNAERVGRLGSAGDKLDYSKDQAGRLRPLSPDFISQSLGLSFPSPSGGPGIAAPSGLGGAVAGGVAAGPAINPVSTPVLPCVNGHQTADPLSPPCVSQFTGDNGGSTWRGVSGNEIKIAVRIPGGGYDPSAPLTNDRIPTEALVDLAKPPDPRGEFFWLTILRLWQEYFNKHFQLYGRKVHLFVYFDSRAPDSALAQQHATRAALDTLLSVQPFGSIETPTFGEPTYLDTLAAHGVVAFDPYHVKSQSQFDRVPGLIWGFAPTTTRMADLYSTYVCEKVAHHPATLSGNPGQNGRPRRFGLVYPAGVGPEYDEMRSRVETELQQCGVKIAARASFPTTTCTDIEFAPQAGSPTTDSAADRTADLLRFQAAGVTTVLWVGCEDAYYGPAAAALHYAPEWIVLGDQVLDAGSVYITPDSLGPTFDHHAVVVSAQPFLPVPSQSYCYQAEREIDPSLPASPSSAVPSPVQESVIFAVPTQEGASEEPVACGLYDGVREVYAALQLAGPRLTPAALKAGLRALPYLASPDPQTPSCFYGDDSTCIEDGIAEYYDFAKDCWRAVEGGRRYLPGRWPSGNIDAQIDGKEPCNYVLFG